MTDPDYREALRTLIGSMSDHDLTELYVRMVQASDYQPIDVLGVDLWRELRSHEDEHDVLRRIGDVCRGCLGMGAA